MNVSIDISGLPITLSECGIVGIWVQEELVLQFTNLKAIKLLFFVFRHVRIIFLLLFSLYVDVAAFYAVFLPFFGHNSLFWISVVTWQSICFSIFYSLCRYGCLLWCFWIPFCHNSSLGLQWSPDRASVFGSSAEDGFLNVWDHEKVTTHTLNYLVFSEGTMHNIGEGDWVQLLVISHLFLWPD